MTIVILDCFSNILPFSQTSTVSKAIVLRCKISSGARGSALNSLKFRILLL